MFKDTPILFTEDTEYIRNNHVVIDIFYSKMSYQQIKEELAYGPIDVIGM